ncbi:zinc-dependent metalloprotease family protein [Novipirellula artificiosorum]|uniref:Uncharacterized protein n=1 Tax=Novipirellula artificiosorum TaxID=2528016 RepID=A0A5C6DXL0_9BACT|nr:zinc-dependent metalloprotease family protein [Novipirellula artificiosorum]TWU41145.1 hypothetical protein Poly41_19830 [Novipirellula artificiosorum]
MPILLSRRATGFVGRIACSLLFSCCVSEAWAEIVTNLSLPISHVVTVQPIIVSNTDGSNTAGYMGDVAQTAAIQFNIDLIWSQAGIDVDWLAPNLWNNSLANVGNLLSTQRRPQADLGQIVIDGIIGGVAHPDPLVLNMYFVEIVPGFSQTTLLTANGLSLTPGNGSALHIGDNLPGAIIGGQPLGQELAAKTIAHEIGHNLGLDHSLEPRNMMLAMDTLPPINAQLNAAQTTLAQSSPYATAVPEPSAVVFLGMVAAIGYRHRRRAA